MQSEAMRRSGARFRPVTMQSEAMLRSGADDQKAIGDVLVIRAELVQAMVAHARADHPDEACGVLAGPEGSDRPERHIAMVNAERSPTFYRFDAKVLLKRWGSLEDPVEVLVFIYHSHTAT
jgi:proteasome lid subunit RPN8/RPN11